MSEPPLPEESLFLDALEYEDGEQRRAFLDRACGADADLRRAVEALLRHHDEAGDFLEAAPTEVYAAFDHLTKNAPATTSLNFLDPSTDPAALGRLGHYEILEVLGSGGCGVVLKARDTKLDRIVAVKTLSQSLASSVTARQRFVREAKAAAAVNHENVVRIHAVFDDGPVPYLVMECVSGTSLQQRLEQAGDLDLQAILRIGVQTACGLAAAHQQGLVHRDVKPGNILLENGVERVKITDFGLARAANDVAITRTGEVPGTPQYMSPEQAQGQPLDARSDLFSLGSVLYAMCTGRSPFRAETTVAALRRVCDDTPRPIREINPEIPDWLTALIDRLLEKNPDDRLQTADEVADVLGQGLAAVQHSAPLPKIVRAQSSSTRRAARYLRPRAVAAAVILAIVATFAMAEGSGITQLTTTVIRLITPYGTLIVETNDPGVRVTIEGDGGLLIDAGGAQEVRVHPGNYKVHAVKDGQPVKLDRDLVTISRGDRQIVRVRLEAEPLAATAPKAEDGAFVVLGAGKERQFDTLADAVLRCSDGDTIEVRGNGPFVTESIRIGDRAIVIRAAAGYRPVIEQSEAGPKPLPPLFDSDAGLVLEGLELRRMLPFNEDFTKGGVFLDVRNAPLHVANCRLLARHSHFIYRGEYATTTTFLNCEIFNSGDAFINHGIATDIRPGTRFTIENCVHAGPCDIAFPQRLETREPARVRLSRNTFVSDGDLIGIWVAFKELPAFPLARDQDIPLQAAVQVESCVFDASVFLSLMHMTERVIVVLPDETETVMKKAIDWRGQQNCYMLRDGAFLKHSALGRFPDRKIFGLSGWQDFWGYAENGSVESRMRYHGGDVLTRLRQAPERLTPEDFRLRPDSAGYRAGPGGKDLGADVNLVGPGPAYERWKKTPEYQEWLTETGQIKK